jgi:hypothetical protein
MYVTALTEWYRFVSPFKPHFNLTVINHDPIDFTITEVIVSNITVWTGESTVYGNSYLDITVDDISEVFALGEFKNPLEVIIKDAFYEPYPIDTIFILNNTAGDVGVRGILIKHNAGLTLPDWLESGKKVTYKNSIWNSTNYDNHTLTTEIYEIDFNESIIKLDWTKKNETITNYETQAYPSISPGFFFTPSHIDLIKNRPTRFLEFLYIIVEEVEVSTEIGLFETYKIKIEHVQPDQSFPIEDYVWVDKATGLAVKRSIRYPKELYGFSSDYLVSSILLDTNIIEGKPIEDDVNNNREGTGIPGFPIESIFMGIVLVLIIKLLSEKK